MTKQLRIIGLCLVTVAITLRVLSTGSGAISVPVQEPQQTPVVSMPMAAPFAVEQQESVTFAASSIHSSRQFVKQYVYGIYARRMLNTHVGHIVLQTWLVCVGLPRARIAYPFHSFW